jgi:hypothetical protein
VAESVEDTIRSLEESEEPPLPWEEEFLKVLEDRDVIFSLASSGIACGPVSTTVVAAIRFESDGEPS